MSNLNPHVQLRLRALELAVEVKTDKHGYTPDEAVVGSAKAYLAFLLEEPTE